ncbi:unnamed protein product [Linum trigynum]|uniref:Uncharacterized protein n=1 Tax=Linum trigynum TaxID=586398 RepID=A0AAV2EIF5_9ROSI
MIVKWKGKRSPKNKRKRNLTGINFLELPFVVPRRLTHKLKPQPVPSRLRETTSIQKQRTGSCPSWTCNRTTAVPRNAELGEHRTRATAPPSLLIKIEAFFTSAPVCPVERSKNLMGWPVAILVGSPFAAAAATGTRNSTLFRNQ